MNFAEARELITDVLARVLRQEPSGLTEDTLLLEELGLDSTGLLEALMELEDSAGFEADVDELDPAIFKTVGSLTDYVSRMSTRDNP